MDQLKWTTPNKAESQRKNTVMNSPKMCITPVKQSELKFKNTVYHKNATSFAVLPSHITPPSGLTKFIARNPFEGDLTNRLNFSTISPTVFNKIHNSPQHSPGFSWNIDELARMQPANFEEYPQELHCVDPEVESKAQAAIDKFFNENQIIPSPWEVKKKEAKQKNKMDLLSGHPDNTNSKTSDVCKSKKEGWSQTVLSLPPQLPAALEEALEPYFTFTQEQNVDNDDANSSTSSLRRKLFFHHDEEQENNQNNSIVMSPVKMRESLALSSSPPQSGMLIHDTPVKQCSKNLQRVLGTPTVPTRNLSPPDISPIHTVMNMSCERVRSCSVTKLDFSADMSIEYTETKNKNAHTESSLDVPLADTSVSRKEKIVEYNFPIGATSFFREYNVSTKKLRKSIDFDIDEENVQSSHNPGRSTQQFKLLTDSCKMFSNETNSVQQINSVVSISEQQSACNSVQDTGYQTYSLSSTMGAVDSCNSTPIKKKMSWGNRILLQEDELRLCDWKENMKNIFSSTPSRCNKKKANHIF